MPQFVGKTRDELWNEYAVLEQRIQNDSRVSYTIVAAALTASFALLGFLLTHDNSENHLGVTFLLGFSAIFLLVVALLVQERFQNTAEIRIARAIQIEDMLGIYSFRLFWPWSVLPDHYFFYLGRRMEKSAWDGTPQMYSHLDSVGREKYDDIMRGLHASHLLRYIAYSLIVLVAGYLVLVIVF